MRQGDIGGPAAEAVGSSAATPVATRQQHFQAEPGPVRGRCGAGWERVRRSIGQVMHEANAPSDECVRSVKAIVDLFGAANVFVLSK